jgi:DNA-binding response OmpR family regulator
MMDRKDSVCALLVGEYEASRLLIHEIFRDCGWRLIEAHDRKAALEHLDRERIHVVITNCETPGSTWRHWLRILSQRVRPPQLIVTSRKADDHLWSEVLNCGGYDVLPEPFRRDEIERVVASARRHYDAQPLRVMTAASARSSVA